MHLLYLTVAKYDKIQGNILYKRYQRNILLDDAMQLRLRSFSTTKNKTLASAAQLASAKTKVLPSPSVFLSR
jgi:hypothetical protein